MSSDVARNETGCRVEPAAGTGADDDGDRLAAVERVDALRMRGRNYEKAEEREGTNVLDHDTGSAMVT